MANDTREARNDGVQVLQSWGVPSDSGEGWIADAALWLTGGVSLLLWTGLALLLTS